MRPGERRKSMPTKKVLNYLLRDIPDELWVNVKITAAKRRQSIRSFILEILNKETGENDERNL